MGSSRRNALIYMILCLSLTAAFLHARSSGHEVSPKTPLAKVLAVVPGWSTEGEIPLDLEIVTSLDLDDYLYQTYAKDAAYISLYIGLYRTGEKVGAAHSPLVCFPGQGWEISKPDGIELETAGGTIHLASMTASKGLHKELLLYWFQARDKTSRGTFQQKLYNFLEGLHRGPTDNAFVRVSIPISENDLEKQRQAAFDFIRDFYPLFLRHITSP